MAELSVSLIRRVYSHIESPVRGFVVIISPALTKHKTNCRKPIAPNRGLAIVLWWYATPGEYRTISCLFGVGISTVFTLEHEVMQALLEALYHRFISLPQRQRLDDTIAGFLRREYPQCAGAIYGTHIPIIPPHRQPSRLLEPQRLARLLYSL